MKSVAYAMFALVVLAVCVLLLKPENRESKPLAPQARSDMADTSGKPLSSNAKQPDPGNRPDITEKDPSDTFQAKGPSGPTDSTKEPDQVFSSQPRDRDRQPLVRSSDRQITDLEKPRAQTENEQGFFAPFSQENNDSGWGPRSEEGLPWPDPKDTEGFPSPFSQEKEILEWGQSSDNVLREDSPVDGFGTGGEGFGVQQHETWDFDLAQ